MKDRYKKESVFYCDSEYGLPNDVQEFMQYWQSKIDLIPEEFKESARICCEATDDGYGCNQFEIDVYYMRPETKEEEDKRVSGNIENTKRIRDRELAQFEKLKAKYDL